MFTFHNIARFGTVHPELSPAVAAKSRTRAAPNLHLQGPESEQQRDRSETSIEADNFLASFVLTPTPSANISNNEASEIDSTELVHADTGSADSPLGKTSSLNKLTESAADSSLGGATSLNKLGVGTPDKVSIEDNGLPLVHTPGSESSSSGFWDAYDFSSADFNRGVFHTAIDNPEPIIDLPTNVFISAFSHVSSGEESS